MLEEIKQRRLKIYLNKMLMNYGDDFETFKDFIFQTNRDFGMLYKMVENLQQENFEIREERDSWSRVAFGVEQEHICKENELHVTAGEDKMYKCLDGWFLSLDYGWCRAKICYCPFFWVKLYE